MKKVPTFVPDVPSATAISPVYQRFLIVMSLDFIHVLRLILSVKLSANLLK